MKVSFNPFDEIALEEAIRCKERGEAREVVAATLGPGALHVNLDRPVQLSREFWPLSPAVNSPASSSWANKPLTTMPIKPRKCWWRY